MLSLWKCFWTRSPLSRKTMRVLILAKDEQIDDNGEISRMEEENEQEEKREKALDVECQWMDLSICSAGGLTQPQAMKLKGELQGQEVLILIDSEASHNFISSKLVQKLGLKRKSTKPYYVRLGDGNIKSTQCCCKNLKVHLGPYMMEGYFFLFNLGGVDLILGVAWLATLGKLKQIGRP